MNVKNGGIPGRLARAVEASGKSQADVAKEANVPLRTFQRYLSAAGTYPDADVLARIVAALGVSGHWLLTDEGEPYPVPQGAKGAAYDAMVELLRATEEPSTDRERIEAALARWRAARDRGRGGGGSNGPPPTGTEGE